MFLTTILFSSLLIQTINPRGITVNADAEAAFRVFTITQTDPTIGTTLVLAVDSVTTTVRVDSGASIRVGDVIKIDTEALTVTAKTGRDLTVSRGSLGTTPNVHNVDSGVSVLKYSSLQEFARSVAIDAIRTMVARYLPDVNSSVAAIEATRKSKMLAAAQ